MGKKACRWLNKNELSGIQIRDNGNIYPCAIRWIPLAEEPEKYKDYKNLTLSEIQDLRTKFLEEVNSGKHSECHNCPLLEEVGEENPIGTVKHLIYHPHTLCSLDCKYCFYTNEQKRLPISEEYKDVYEVIKHFYDIGLLNKEEFCLDLGGGEPTLLDNIDKTVEFMSKTWKNPKFCLLSNSTVTEKANQLIEDLKCKYKNVTKVLITSIDAGTAKTYEQIRRKDYYYQVADNLYNYAKNNIFDEMVLKYIFLDDMSNADDDNIFGFLHLCKTLDMVNKYVIKISFDIDWQSRKYNDDEIPDKLLKIIGKMYYFVTEVLDIDYYFASDYLNKSTKQGSEAIKKVLQYAKEYESKEKTKRELYEIESLNQKKYNIISSNCVSDSKSIKEKLQICIITYNRKGYLERTLNQLFDINSPVRNFDIAVMDNASTDGTSELIDEYCKKYPNLEHIRHEINIGGNANVIKSFEYAKAKGKEYFWGLCDDDKFDFSNWEEVEENINKGKDIICLSNYAIQYNSNGEISLSDKLVQMTFFPAGIYKTELLESNTLINMYYSISDCFPHLCVTISAINEGKEITVLSKPIVFNGLHCDNSCKDLAYTRGAEKKSPKAVRLENSCWALGYANILKMLKDKSNIRQIFKEGILHNEIYGNWYNFYLDMYVRYFDNKLYNYLYEIFSLLPLKNKLIFLLKTFVWRKKNVHANCKNKKDWFEYFKRQKFQNKIDKIARKLKGKKVLWYGNGMISQVLQENYDLSKLNIVGITDRKYLGCDGIKCKYTIIPPNKLNSINYDVIIVALKQFENTKLSLNDKGNKKEIIRLV